MKFGVRKGLVLATAIMAFGPVSALAAGSPANVRGTIERVDGDNIAIKTRDGRSAEVHVANDARIATVTKASLSDIKPGTFIGTAATPRTDGTLQAIEIHIFPESMRGTGEGNRAWDLAPRSSMTNGTVKQGGKVENNKVNKVEGNNVVVDYNGGSKTVAITPATKVVMIVPGDRSELKPKALVFIPAATTNPDGTLEAKRMTVGKEGIAPPM